MSNSSSSDRMPGPGPWPQQPLASPRTTNTWAIWVMVLLPLLGSAITIAEDPGAEFRRIIARSVQQIHDARGGVVDTPMPFDSFTLISWGFTLVLVAVQVALAIVDQRTLKQRGVIRPFPLGWVFLNPTYIIGRHVVVRRRVHGSLWPLWVFIVTEVIALAVSATVITIAINDAVMSLQVR